MSFGSDHRVFDHAVQFYLDDSFLVRMTGELIASALRTSDAAVVIATASHHQAIVRHLQGKGLDIAAHSVKALTLKLMLRKFLTDSHLMANWVRRTCPVFSEKQSGWLWTQAPIDLPKFSYSVN